MRYKILKLVSGLILFMGFTGIFIIAAGVEGGAIEPSGYVVWQIVKLGISMGLAVYIFNNVGRWESEAVRRRPCRKVKQYGRGSIQDRQYYRSGEGTRDYRGPRDIRL